MTSTHLIRIEPAAYRAIAVGEQQALCVRRDEGIVAGDYVVLREYERKGGTGGYTGVWLARRVSSLLTGEGIEPTHAVASLGDRNDSERATLALRRQLGLAERQGVSADRFFRAMERKERARREVLRRSLERVSRVTARPEPAIEAKA